MCLDTLIERPSKAGGIGYVVRSYIQGQLRSMFWNCGEPYYANKQYHAEMKVCSYAEFCYVSGFHIFEVRGEALAFMRKRCSPDRVTVVPVAYQRAHTRGLDGGFGPVVIAESIRHLAKKPDIHSHSPLWYGTKFDFDEWDDWRESHNLLEVIEWNGLTEQDT